MSLDIYVFAGSYQCEPFATTHIQRRGAMIMAILDMCEFLGIEDDQSVTDLHDFEETDRDVLIYDSDKLEEMDTEQITKVYQAWSNRQQVWENSQGYHISIIKTRLVA